ncbi:MAG: class I SAM-dependent methyltransferase [Alphaproteobacteria bacterium]|nr:class I SAM-dependent methyltransferase [Alphaproteobacteria bacterium]
MFTDIVDLRDFYASRRGQVARRLIRARIRRLWPDARGLSVLGLGFATPYLTLYREEAARLVAAMPASQGVLPWPRPGPNLVTLAEETELPFPDLSFDRVLLVHALEGAEQLRPMLREAWRVLAGNGRLLVVAPNRRGVWARSDRTPFGHGQPYSLGQLSRLLRDTLFTPVQSATALFLPPQALVPLARWSREFDRFGERWASTFAGVVMVEAAKQIYAGTVIPQGTRKRKRMLVPIQGGAAPAAARHSATRPDEA